MRLFRLIVFALCIAAAPGPPVLNAIFHEPTPPAGGSYCTGSTDLACYDFDEADTTDDCSGAVGVPTDTQTWTCSDNDCVCDVTDGTEVFEFNSDGTNCSGDNANALSWQSAWGSTSAYISFCFKITGGTYDGMTIMEPFNGGGVINGLGGTGAAIKIDAATDDEIGIRCPGSVSGTTWEAGKDVIDGSWHAAVLEVGVATDDDTWNLWVDEATSGATTTCDMIGGDTTFNGLSIEMCESDDTNFAYRLDNIRIQTSKPANATVAALECGS